jgi:hypothetical protein
MVKTWAVAGWFMMDSPPHPSMGGPIKTCSMTTIAILDTSLDE